MEYIKGFKDESTGKFKKVYIEICQEIKYKLPNSTTIVPDTDKKEFIKLFGEFLKIENILKNFDEFENDKQIEISESQKQDMKSAYTSYREYFIDLCKKNSKSGKESAIKLDDVEYHIELLKTDEINLYYIFKLICDKRSKKIEKEEFMQEITRIIRTSIGAKAKENLIIEFINNTDLNKFVNSCEILEAFYLFAKEKKEIEKIIKEEGLKEQAKDFIEESIVNGCVDISGDKLIKAMPPVSRMKGAWDKKKNIIFNKVNNLVEIFQGI